MTEEEITEQAWTLVFGAMDQLPKDRRLPWLREFLVPLTLLAAEDVDDEIERLTGHKV